MKPVEPWLDADKQICIVPDKILNYLPFGALITPSGKYLMEEKLLGRAPSSSIFITCSDSAAERAAAVNERLLSIGDPKFDRQYFKSYNYLPAAQEEATRISMLYKPSLLLVGPEAVKKTVKAEMMKSAVIHLAMHAVTEAHSSMRSKLLLAKECNQAACQQEPDGVLYADEIYNLSLPLARLVVLSSCRSGVENYYSGEGMVGISRPFIAQRVPLVVASLWPVESGATAALMMRFHKYRKAGEGMPTSVALRRAQQDMLDPDNQYHHPYYWAGFTLIGGYARF